MLEYICCINPCTRTSAPWTELEFRYTARDGFKKRTKYKYIKYKLEKNHVKVSTSSAYFDNILSNAYWPFKNNAFTCQLKTPGTIVKFDSDTTKPACSNHENVYAPLINRKSDTPAYLSINAPNQINVNALLQQQKVIKINDSSKYDKLKPVTA